MFMAHSGLAQCCSCGLFLEHLLSQNSILTLADSLPQIAANLLTILIFALRGSRNQIRRPDKTSSRSIYIPFLHIFCLIVFGVGIEKFTAFDSDSPSRGRGYLPPSTSVSFEAEKQLNVVDILEPARALLGCSNCCLAMAVATSHAYPGFNNSSTSPSISSHTNHSNFANRQSDCPVSSTHSGASHPAMAPAPMAKRSKGKKPSDPSETSKLLAAKISQLEQDAAGEKDQEAEIEREVKKATRDLNQLLNSIESPATRVEAVQKRYSDLLAEMKKLDRDYAKSRKRADQLQKDQDKGKAELNKIATMKDKLEKLCRELTKENKKVKDENKRLEETEKKARGLVNARLDSLLFDIQDFVTARGDARGEKADIDLDDAVRAKIKTIGDKFEAREHHYKSLLRSKDAEIQSLTAKYEEQRRAAENEAHRCRALSTQVSTFSQTEAELRSQLNIYVEKFKQVEDTLNNSNELFLTFRKEMEEMAKKTKRLEKENMTLTRKHEQTNRNILEMAEERTRNNDELEKWRKKSNNLEALCRRMQEQGRGQALAGELDAVDDEGTESEYDDEYEDEEDDEDISDEGEYDDDRHHHHHHHGEHQHGPAPNRPPDGKPVFGPPPPPALTETKSNGHRGVVNGYKH
ncbi:hypothetical protein PAAG_00706 [Paracoccidioides lutzii Pb01]|uniref:Alpha-taxilin n=1 Tax=Paracoccidioides lutzii (strain ATCC MYA-826 / Pb01) TaxID=502779 RepID=C1GQB1_PARBA|nr:hypothetical protein PAAG_00706 [Paracoccidioides lutzii Pb01]EEH37785.2 hypothetical protein PAAG_00706 [Paracoccidioides lutzii Pb01]